MLIEYHVVSEPHACTISAPAAAARTGSTDVRLPADPDARAHRLPPSHRILGPGGRWSGRSGRSARYPSGACRAVREQDSNGRSSGRTADAAARALEGRRWPSRARRRRARSRSRAASCSSDPRHRAGSRPFERRERRRQSSRRATSAACRHDRRREARPVALPGARDANALFKGIPQNGLALGGPNAPVHDGHVHRRPVPVLPRLRGQRPADDRHQVHPRRARCSSTLKPWAFLGRSPTPAGSA